MYDELIKRVRKVAEEVCDDYDVDPYIVEQRFFVIEEAADAIEVLSKTEKTTKPHGRLIDADPLKEQLEYVASLEWNQRVGASPGIECAIDMLDDAQTVIPASMEGE